MHGEEILPEGTDNPVGGVQIHDKYYCDICRIGFNERPEFARHRRFHRKTRSGGYRNRPPLTDGMIMKDGKYRCQFCPKVFDRLTSYTGHVRIHLRRNLKCSSTSIEAAPRAAHTYYGKDPRGARVRLRPRAYSRVDNLRLLSEISIRDKEEELANLRLLSEVSERLI
nr:methyl-cpg-binding domain-containing protein 8 [Ipomoea batatas]